jgi:hypothetical protein
MANDKAIDNGFSKTVTVACKIGVPWIDYEVCKPVEVAENTQTGTRMVKQWIRTGKVARIRGTAYPRGEPPEGFPEKPRFVLGYALTPNIDRSIWETIVEQRQLAPEFANGMVFAFEREEDIRSKAKDYQKQLSGFEPIARNKDEILDTRLPKPISKGVSGVSPGIRE